MTGNGLIAQTSVEDPTTKALAEIMNPVLELLRGITESQRLLNERMDKMEKQNALAMRVTATQAKALNDAIRQRAASLADDYGGPPEAVELIARAIRRDVRLLNGINSTREIPRCEYSVVSDQINMWEDYDAIQDAMKKTQD